MATPNYSYEKRQRELAKKRKKEEKLKRKADVKPGDPEPGSDESMRANDAPGSVAPAGGAGAKG